MIRREGQLTSRVQDLARASGGVAPRPRSGRKSKLGPDRWLAIVLLAFWAQLVFGVAMTAWRYSLILFSGWQAYPSGVPSEFDGFIQLATTSCAAPTTVVYLSPPGDEYTSRFARMNYFFYPRKTIWLGLGARKSPVSRWMPTDLSAPTLARVVGENRVACLLVDDVTKPVPLAGGRIAFDSQRYLIKFAR